MDSRQFDDIAKTFARGASRRRVLKGILAAAAVALGAVGLAAPDRERAAAAPQGCKTAGKVCKSSDQCCRPLVCFAGTCALPTPTPVPTNTPTPTGPVCTATCGSPGQCGAGCVCAQSVEGAAFCVSISSGNCAPGCTSSAQCPGGFCATAACCGSPACVPATNICAP
jgi:hypothetical protein